MAYPSFDKQTLEDLEYHTVIDWLKVYAVGPSALGRIAELIPSNDFKQVDLELRLVDELVQIKRVGESFPALQFEELKAELKMLGIKNSVLSEDSFSRIILASEMVNALLYFFNKREAEYPLLTNLLEGCYFTKDIIEAIHKVFDKQGKVKDDASVELTEIRRTIRTLQQQISRNFDREMRKLMRSNILAETKEAFLNDRRVLSVLASHKRSIEGNVLGSSKTGNVVYIEPQSNVPLNLELALQEEEERKEIYRILKELTKTIAQYQPLLEAYQKSLIAIDFVNAKARLAMELEANLPKIEKEMNLELIDAYHPILRKNNKLLKKNTLPQRINLHQEQRMLIISGPNAGGKSITLKTVGLLQLMLQSGLLIPVDANSKCCFFQQVLSDIGDNQSIENELSTYSYRLKRMNHFLQVANRRTLLLLDEFGTGSDPDLGGALAEVIFEKLYQKKSFAVITTHYGNIKLKADKLPQAFNGCMLFDTDTLTPLFKFSAGQPGSSFTFEVAQINGIPLELIQLAKGKIDRKKVKMDELLSDLQKEKNYFERLNKEHREAQERALRAEQKFLAQEEKLTRKLSTQEQFQEKNNKLVILGNKLQSFIDKYQPKSRKKNINDDLMNEVKKYLAVEKGKVVANQEKARIKKAENKPKKQAPQQRKDEFQQSRIKVGSTVKLIATRQSGTVEEINGDMVTVLFGFMRLKVELDKLMWIS